VDVLVVFGWNNSHLLVFDCLVKQNYKTQFNYTSTRKKTKTKRKRTNISRKIDDKVLHEMKVTRMDFNKKKSSITTSHLETESGDDRNDHNEPCKVQLRTVKTIGVVG